MPRAGFQMFFGMASHRPIHPKVDINSRTGYISFMDAAVHFPYARIVTGPSGTREREREFQRGYRGQSSRPAARPEKVIDLAPQNGVWAEKGTLLAVTSNARSLNEGRSVVYNRRGQASTDGPGKGLYINVVA